MRTVTLSAGQRKHNVLLTSLLGQSDDFHSLLFKSAVGVGPHSRCWGEGICEGPCPPLSHSNSEPLTELCFGFNEHPAVTTLLFQWHLMPAGAPRLISSGPSGSCSHSHPTQALEPQEADGCWGSVSRAVCAWMLSSSSVGGLFTASVVYALHMHVPVGDPSSAKPADAWVSPALTGQRGSFRDPGQNEDGTKSWWQLKLCFFIRVL